MIYFLLLVVLVAGALVGWLAVKVVRKRLKAASDVCTSWPAEERILRLAMTVMADFGLDWAAGAATVVENWLKIRVDASAQQTLRGVFSMHAPDQALRRKMLSGLATAEEAKRYGALELWLELAALAPKVNMAQLVELRDMAMALGLNRERFSEMKLRKLHHFQINEESLVEIETVFDIESVWTVEQKQARLRALYQHWNPLQTANDPQRREQAQVMLRRIAICRTLLRQ